MCSDRDCLQLAEEGTMDVTSSDKKALEDHSSPKPLNLKVKAGGKKEEEL